MKRVLVFSIYEHQYLGVLIGSYLIAKDFRGQLTLDYRGVSKSNMHEFPNEIYPEDFKIIELLDDIEQHAIIKKYHKKPIQASEYFTKHYTEKVHEIVRNYIENKLVKALYLMKNSHIFIMDKDGYPGGKLINYPEEPAKILFQLKRYPVETRYYPTIRYKDTIVRFNNPQSAILVNSPLWLLTQDGLYNFSLPIEGVKLKPFFTKTFINVPKTSEEVFYRKFFLPLADKFPIRTEGVELIIERPQGAAVLKYAPTWNEVPFFTLIFRYNDKEFLANNTRYANTLLEGDAEKGFTFIKTERNKRWEEGIIQKVLPLGFEMISGATYSLKSISNLEQTIHWLGDNADFFEKNNITIEADEITSKYALVRGVLDWDIKNEIDWFDVKAVIQFGEFSIPFIRLKRYILDGNREFKLPDGKIAIIPEEWFSRLQGIFTHGRISETDDSIQLNKHHFYLLDDDAAEDGIKLNLENINPFKGEMPTIQLPENFIATPRPYQQAGYDWLWFLRSNKFGGVLADDMGLGKTLQTLMLLLKDLQENKVRKTSLLVVPASLLHNWLAEAKKFTPDLRVVIYAGKDRAIVRSAFKIYDLVVTSYATARIDCALLQKIDFNYLIFDEAQALKNPNSATTKALANLHSRHRLALTGTPVENSLQDLWSIFNVVMPGFLGSQKYFSEKFVSEIERKGNEQQVIKLKGLINPFMLRRKKEQVAKDLPEKVEQIISCTMTEEQESLYESVKSSFRNEILQTIEEHGMAKSSMVLLRGLTKLRQIANHPKMIDPTYAFSSGKFEQLIDMIDTSLAEGHKILVFSQFVKHLAIVQDYLIEQKIEYHYLDGSTPAEERQRRVTQFNTEDKKQIFLISLKAGGVGLNLTSADYVILLDPWWNPAVEQQAIDRSHRIGQLRTVFAYKFVTQNTIEEKIIALQNAKRKISESVITVDASFVKSLNLEDIKSLLD